MKKQSDVEEKFWCCLWGSRAVVNLVSPVIKGVVVSLQHLSLPSFLVKFRLPKTASRIKACMCCKWETGHEERRSWCCPTCSPGWLEAYRHLTGWFIGSCPTEQQWYSEEWTPLHGLWSRRLTAVPGEFPTYTKYGSQHSSPKSKGLEKSNWTITIINS